MSKINFDIQEFDDLRERILLFTDNEISEVVELIPHDKRVNTVRKEQNNNQRKSNRYGYMGGSYFKEIGASKIYFEELKVGNIKFLRPLLEQLKLIEQLYKKHQSIVVDYNTDIQSFLELKDSVKAYEFCKLVSTYFDIKYLNVYFKVLGIDLEKIDTTYIDTITSLTKVSMDALDVELKTYKELHSKEIEEYKVRLMQEQKESRDKYRQVQKGIQEKEEQIKRIGQEKYHYCQEVKKLNKNMLVIQEKKKQSEILNENLNKEIQKLERALIDSERRLEERNESFKNKLTKEWENECDKLFEINRGLEDNNKQLESEKQIKIVEISQLKEQKKKLKNQIKLYEQTVDNFVNNIDIKCIEYKLNSFINCNEKNDIVAVPEERVDNIYCKPHQLRNVTIEYYDEIYNVINTLYVDLEKSGVAKDSVKDVASYLLSCIMSNITPLLCGFGARNIAKVLSANLVSSAPLVITLPAGYNNSRLLIEKIKTSEARCILIEDVIGTLSDNCILPLLREIQEEDLGKIILLSTEQEEALKFLPTYILNYISPINFYFECCTKNPHLNYGDGLPLICEYREENRIGENNNREWKKVLLGTRLNGVYIKQREKLLHYVKKLTKGSVNSTLEIMGLIEWSVLWRNEDFSCNIRNYLKKHDYEELLVLIEGEY